MKKFLIIILILISSCNSNLSDKNTFLLTSDLPAGEFVKESGKKLINQPFGFTKIIADSAQNDSTLLIAVHGYDSRGYEWVSALNQLANKYNNTYFYRYDWEICPDSISRNLADLLTTLIQGKSNFNRIVIFGHSYGGLVVTYLAGNMDVNIPIEIHTIASPLAGYPRIMDNCDLLYNDDDKLIYSSWDANISHYQWRTHKQQDGAFRDLDFNPQDINFDNGEIILLPETMNGQRLGHNWSITWVIDNYLNN
jgi:hypothetical protein